MIMTRFHISDIFDRDLLQDAVLAMDNAAGHGNFREEERRRKRQHSQVKSQLYMCRKPRRTTDDRTSTCVHRCKSISGISTRHLPLHQKSLDREQLHRVSSTMTMNALYRKQLMEMSVSQHMEAVIPTMNGNYRSSRNASKPERQASLENVDSLFSPDDDSENDSQEDPADVLSLHEKASTLANILSTIKV